MSIAIICGMRTEQNIINAPPGSIVIQGRDADTLIRSDLETAIAKGGIQGVISVGVCGALAHDLAAGDIVVASVVTSRLASVVASGAWKTNILAALGSSGFNVRSRAAVFTYSSRIISSTADKAALRASSRTLLAADVVDMETWQAAIVAARHGLPFAALRTISDPADFSLPPAALVAMTGGGAINYGAVAASLVGQPDQVAALIKLDEYDSLANDNLAAAMLQVGMNFGFPGAVR